MGPSSSSELIPSSWHHLHWTQNPLWPSQWWLPGPFDRGDVLHCCDSSHNTDQIANIHWIIEKAREFQKNIYFHFVNNVKAFDCVDHNQLWKILKEMEIPDHLICLLRNLHAGQKATVRTGHGTTDWFLIGKGECQGCILSPCLFNLYAEYIMRNAGLDEAQAGIKIAVRNVNNLRYADDTTLMAEASWWKWKKVKSLA